MTHAQFCKHLASLAAQLGGKTKLAQQTGTAKQRINDYIHGHRIPPQSFLDAIGFEVTKTTEYVFQMKPRKSKIIG